MEHNFLTFIKIVKKSYLAEKTGEKSSYIRDIKHRGFPRKVKIFYNLCIFLKYSPCDFNENSYEEKLKQILKSRKISMAWISKKMNLEYYYVRTLINSHSRSVKSFILLYKCFQNVKPQESWYDGS